MNKFTYRADANGYMLYWCGLPLGGVSVLLPRDKPLRGNQARCNRMGNEEEAQLEIRHLESGEGHERFKKKIKEYENSLAIVGESA
jgi:hypothetical protein